MRVLCSNTQKLAVIYEDAWKLRYSCAAVLSIFAQVAQP